MKVVYLFSSRWIWRPLSSSPISTYVGDIYMEGVTSHSFIQSGTCDEFDRICKNFFCFLPHCCCITPLTLILNLIILLLQVKTFKRLNTFKRILTSMKISMMKFFTPLPPNKEGFIKNMNQSATMKHGNREKKRKSQETECSKPSKVQNTYILNMKMCEKTSSTLTHLF